MNLTFLSLFAVDVGDVQARNKASQALREGKSNHIRFKIML